ncbi:unnamed protein product, partial [marine sediment metagenome]
SAYGTRYWWRVCCFNGTVWTNETYHFTTEILNNDPDMPSVPSGSVAVDVGVSGEYSTSALDPDGDMVQYRFDWDAAGSHEYSIWTLLGVSGHTGSMS